MNNGEQALLVLDVVNEIVRADGAWAKMGYGPQAEERNVVEKTARAVGIPVIYVTVGFPEWPSGSPVFMDEGKEARLLQLGTRGRDIHETLGARDDEVLVTKKRVSPFYATFSEVLLRTQGRASYSAVWRPITW